MSEVTPGDNMQDAVAEAERRFPDDFSRDGDRFAARNSFIAGARWAAARHVSPVTREYVQELIAETREAANGQEWVNHSDTLLDRLADALESLSVSPPAEVTDDMVERADDAYWANESPIDTRDGMRVALEAALGAPPAEVEWEYGLRNTSSGLVGHPYPEELARKLGREGAPHFEAVRRPMDSWVPVTPGEGKE